VVLASFGYQPGTTGQAMEGWKELVDYVEANEAEALAYAVFEEAETNTVRSVQLFANREFVTDVHVGGEGIRRNREQNGRWRDGRREIVKARVVLGFLGR
jgi:hypothetical protein